MTQAFVVVKFTRLTLATRIVQLAAALNTRSTSHAPPRGSGGSCLSIIRRAQLAGARRGGGGGGVNSLELIRIGEQLRARHISTRDDLDPSSPYTPTSLLATVGAPGASRLCAATPIVLESHACLCDGVTAGAHAYFVWPARRARRPGGRRPERRARRAYVYVGRGGARRGHARGDRPGRCECRRGAARTGQWWWPAGAARRPARQGGLPVHPCARGAGRAPTGAARRIAASISGRNASACPPLRPSIFSAIHR